MSRHTGFRSLLIAGVMREVVGTMLLYGIELRRRTLEPTFGSCLQCVILGLTLFPTSIAFVSTFLRTRFSSWISMAFLIVVLAGNTIYFLQMRIYDPSLFVFPGDFVPALVILLASLTLVASVLVFIFGKENQFRAK